MINGPTILGSEVGERIVQGLFLALRAAAAGKTSLQIAAHSRGAVETILILHELDRIKKELAGLMLKEKKYDLASLPSTENFYTTVKARAISLGAPDPTVASLSKTIEEQRGALAAQLESMAALNKIIVEQHESLAEKDKSITTKYARPHPLVF